MSYDLTHLTRQKDNKLLAEKVKEQFGKTKEGLTAGNALEVLSDRGDTDKVPYIFRKTGGSKKAYNREMLKKIVGGTVAWNQLVQNGNFGSTTGWNTIQNKSSITASGNVGVITALAAQGNMQVQINTPITLISGHKYFATVKAKASSSVRFCCGFSGNWILNIQSPTADTWYSAEKIITFTDGVPDIFKIGWEGVPTINDTISAKDVMVIDLTKIFGSTIADAIYAMELATADSGVAFFRSLFPNYYYAYDAGTLMSVQVKEHRTVGFNQINGLIKGARNTVTGLIITDNTNIATDLIRVIPELNYEIYGSNFGQNKVYRSDSDVCCYDLNKKFIGKNKLTTTAGSYNSSYWKMEFNKEVAYVSFTLRPNSGNLTVEAVQNDVCLHLVLDGKRDKEYEPYAEHVYPLDADLELRGIPKLDSDGNLYYDGDEYTPDGNVRRKCVQATFDGSSDEDWRKRTSDDNPYFYKVLGNKGYVLSGAEYIICDKYNSNYVTGGNTNTGICVVSSSGYNQSFISVRPSDYETLSVDDFVARLAQNPITVVYELATPITETADPYHEIQICSRYGTEEFVDAGVTASTPTRDVSIPVGTDTFYPESIREKAEMLPSSIAPQEWTNKATATHASGSLFIWDNKLLKASTLISAGETIVIGASGNCTETTIATELAALLAAINA